MDGVGEGRMKIIFKMDVVDRKGEAAGGNGEHERWVRGAGCVVRAGGGRTMRRRVDERVGRGVFLMCVVSVSVGVGGTCW